MGLALALFIPSATARVGAVIPIMVGITAALGLAANSSLGATLMIVTAQACSIFNMGIKTGAAAWLAQQTLGQLGLAALPVVTVIAALSIFNIVLHLGFASATGLASTLIPIFIAFAETLPVSRETAFGIVMIQSFVVSFGFILPTNAPQNMLCYGTNAFGVLQFAKVGVVMTLAGLGLILLLSATLWPMMGVL